MARLGIDFGTTNTVVVASDRGRYPVVPHASETSIGRIVRDVFPSLAAYEDDGARAALRPRRRAPPRTPGGCRRGPVAQAAAARLGRRRENRHGRPAGRLRHARAADGVRPRAPQLARVLGTLPRRRAARGRDHVAGQRERRAALGDAHRLPAGGLRHRRHAERARGCRHRVREPLDARRPRGRPARAGHGRRVRLRRRHLRRVPGAHRRHRVHRPRHRRRRRAGRRRPRSRARPALRAPHRARRRRPLAAAARPARAAGAAAEGDDLGWRRAIADARSRRPRHRGEAVHRLGRRLLEGADGRDRARDRRRRSARGCRVRRASTASIWSAGRPAFRWCRSCWRRASPTCRWS